MTGRLAGRAAYVTGGSRGIGRGIALALAGEGAAVVVADTEAASAEAVAAEIREAGGRAEPCVIDVRNYGDLVGMVEQVERQYGQLDIAVNCAGVISVASVEDVEEAEWDRVMDVNVKGVFLSCKAAIPAMRRNAFGRIINISSVSGKDGYPKLAAYSASKYAVLGFTNSLAKELARDGITVNAICPGVVKTQMWDTLSEELKEQGETPEESWLRHILEFVPQGRPQTPEEVGGLAIYLALAPSVTGQSINIDGGLTSH
ncbi:SDR family NAD(P)-dependent oxidoreductase [Mesorhizobium sp. CA7]|uniref:SDR family NAD(P)-dependent oxidoreductase n=1 Tax=Mesorhizobium sp. CA7 TaxID=588501 RepID=UPI001CCB968A|nr:SDR family NAD(P)-dependent oxidoreductase [Mesorhizobium sp. CA7]MBZ9813849.1 SDR family oxidoreductase [Mesorhizobium sp. CA7]